MARRVPEASSSRRRPRRAIAHRKSRLHRDARAGASPRSARPALSAAREPAPNLRSHTGAGTGTPGTLRCREPCAPRPAIRPGPPRHVRRAESVPPAQGSPRLLDLRVRRDVPAHLRLGAGSALLVLLRIFHVDLREVERDVLGQPVLTARPAGRDRRDENVLQLDDQVLERVLTGLAHGQLRLRNVLAVAARQHEIRRRDIDVLGQRQVLHIHLARTGATAQVGRPRIDHAPAPGQDRDLVLVLAVYRLALDAIQLQEHVNGHGSSPLARYRVIVRPSFPRLNFVLPDSRYFPPLADGSFDTSRSDTVKPSSW